MDIELEAKFLDINAEEIRKLLKQNGGVLIHSERLMIRKNFDFPDNRLEKIGGWVRIRDEGDKIVLAYKQLVNRKIDGTKEISVEVKDLERTSDFLLAIGLNSKSWYETKRERWDLDGVGVTIDTWPWIPTFIEIESLNEEKIKETAKKLNLDWDRVMHGSVEIAYQKYYNVSEAEVDSWEVINFVLIPDWLEVKRK